MRKALLSLTLVLIAVGAARGESSEYRSAGSVSTTGEEFLSEQRGPQRRPL